MQIQKNNKKSLAWQKQLLFTVAFVVLVGLGANLSFKWADVAVITLQTLFLGVLFYYMKTYWRLAAIIIYLILGISGLPLFSEGTHGWDHFTGNYLGFFIGFILSSFVKPIKGNYQQIFSYFILLHFVIIAAGTSYLAILNKSTEAYSVLGLSLIPVAVIKSLLGAAICYLIQLKTNLQ